MRQHDTAHGLLFSNANHRVIFINKTLQAMLNFPEKAASHFIGEPAHKILGISEAQYKIIARQVLNAGNLNSIPLELTNQLGEKVQITARGVSHKDNKGELISIDYTFIDPDLSDVSSPPGTDLSVYLVHEVVRFYFKRQLEGLYSAMKNWGGNRLAELFNNIINGTAKTHNWDLSMDGDKITDNSDTMRFDSYYALLVTAAATVKKVLGDTVMSKQVETVNKKTNPMTFDYIDQDWYKKI